MVGGGAQHADTIDSYLTGKVARLVGYLRDHGVWLMKRRGRHGLCRRCNGEGKGDMINNLIIVSHMSGPGTQRGYGGYIRGGGTGA